MKYVLAFFITVIVTAGIISQLPWQPVSTSVPTLTPTLSPTPTPTSIPISKIIENDYHIFQTFNNCGPAALSMALSYYGIQRSQHELGIELRPYQNPQGDNDDKSVTLEEVAIKANEYNLLSYHRPNGSIQLIKQFIASGIPVITRTLLKPDEDIGHFRIVKGYDDTTLEFIEDDSLQGHNLRYEYELFSRLWQTFNYEYVVLVPPEKEYLVQNILGVYIDEKTAWQQAIINSQQELLTSPDDIVTRFNLSLAAYHVGDYQKSVTEFEKIEHRLPWRTLWYQIEPIQAYFELGNYDRVFTITENILQNHNRAFSELYLLRGEIYKLQGNIPTARDEFEKAVYYNRSLKSAREALTSVQ